MYFVYILKSEKKDWYYIGHSNNIEQRVTSHNTGKNKSTKPYRPFLLVYQETYQTKGEAFKRENQIKRYKHDEAFKKLLKKE